MGNGFRESCETVGWAKSFGITHHRDDSGNTVVPRTTRKDGRFCMVMDEDPEKRRKRREWADVKARRGTRPPAHARAQGEALTNSTSQCRQASSCRSNPPDGNWTWQRYVAISLHRLLHRTLLPQEVARKVRERGMTRSQEVLYA